MKRMLNIGILIITGLTLQAFGGSLEPSAAPTAGTMKPLSDVEPRIAIHQSDIPKTISTSGSYYLAENVTSVGSGIIVNADNVTIDLNGFTMTGPGSGAFYGIYMFGRSNVEIRNGTIQNFSYGIYEGSANGKGHRILNIRAVSNISSGIILNSYNCQVRDCTIQDNGTSSNSVVYGIYVGMNAVVTGNTVYNNGRSATASVEGINANNGSIVCNNAVYCNGRLGGNIVFGIYTGNCCTVNGNISHYTGNNVSGMYSVCGIIVGFGTIVSGNSVSGTGNYSSTTGTIYGIYVSGGCTVIGNAVYANGYSASGTVYGIYLYGYDLVNNNTVYSNNGTNMNTPASCMLGTNLY